MLQAELKVTSGKQAGNTIPLPQGKFLVGREEDCHLRPNSDMVSRHHCVFTIDEYAVRVRDLGSTNGTLLNGERIRGGVVLSQGDIVVIGKLEFEVLIHDPANEATQSNLSMETQTEIPQTKPAEDAPAEEAPAEEVTAQTEPQEQEEEVSTSATLTEMPVVDPEQVDAASQTQILPPAGDTQFAQPGIPMQPPIGYPMGYPPQMMQYGYPQQMPGYPPQMPGYPPQQMPGYPPQQMPGYPPQQMPPQQMPQQPMPEVEEPAAPAADANDPAIKLPDPSTTGAKPPEPKPDPPAGEAAEKPADTGGGVDSVIQQYLKRRPGSAQ